MSLYQIRQLSHSYDHHGPVLAIDDWTIPTGSIVGLIGPNGSGKTTLLKLLGLIERPSRGDIYFYDQKAAPFAPGMRGRIALLPQESYLLQRSIYKNVAYGLRIRKDRNREVERVRDALSLVGLNPDRFGDRPWFALSGGEARRVALAARLVLQPQVLLLDEPTTSVDVASAQMMKEAVLHAHRRWGTSLIIASHDVQWLQEVCDQTMHLFGGKLLGRRRRTLLHGPWEIIDGRQAAMRLSDEDTFVAAEAPPQAEATAVIDPEKLSITAEGPPPAGRRIIRGVLASLALDKPSGDIEAAVVVGHTTFHVRLTDETLSAAALIPGRRVSITYDPDDVQWAD